MSYNEQDANKYICYLAANMWRFPLWVEERRREERANGESQDRHIESGDNQDRG